MARKRPFKKRLTSIFTALGYSLVVIFFLIAVALSTRDFVFYYFNDNTAETHATAYNPYYHRGCQYRFEVDGKTYENYYSEIRFLELGRCDKDEKFIVRYEKNNPEKNVVNAAVGWKEGLLLLSSFTLAIALFVFNIQEHYRKKRRKNKNKESL